MKMKVFIMLVILTATCHCQIRNRPADTRTLLLSDQELRFAGYALQTVFSSNPNAYRSRKGNRRFSGTFTIIEEGCGGLDIRINADVELLSTGVRNRVSDAKYPIQPSVYGNGYAKKFNY